MHFGLDLDKLPSKEPESIIKRNQALDLLAGHKIRVVTLNRVASSTAVVVTGCTNFSPCSMKKIGFLNGRFYKLDCDPSSTPIKRPLDDNGKSF